MDPMKEKSGVASRKNVGAGFLRLRKFQIFPRIPLSTESGILDIVSFFHCTRFDFAGRQSAADFKVLKNKMKPRFDARSRS